MGAVSWTKEELERLASVYPTSTNEQLLDSFPNRSLTSIYKRAYRLGFRKSKDVEFQNRSNSRKREKASNWNGGIKITEKGYRCVLSPDNPRADRNGYVLEHILVFEEHTGITIPKNCCIHHLNGIKTDNRIENLCMMEHGAHTRLHNLGRKMSETTKESISRKAIARFSDKRNHPSYKDVGVDEMIRMRKSGDTVVSICKHYGISRRTYYNKLEEYNAQLNNLTGTDN